MKKFFIQSLSLVISGALVFSNNAGTIVFAQEQADEKLSSQIPSTIDLLVGDVEVIGTKNLIRVAVTNPDLVDISDAKPNNVTLVGKKAGQTEVLIWDDNGKQAVSVRVASQDLDILKGRIQEVLDKAQVKGVSLEKNANEGKVVLYGNITKEDKLTIEKIMDPYFDKIINLLKEDINEDTIQIDAQIIEVNTSIDKTLGIDWSLNPTYTETLPNFDGSVGDFFKIGDFNRTTAFLASLNTLVGEGKGRVLSKPRLVVKNGKEASFLVGGEIPIRTSTVNTTGTVENISYKQYGVNMTVTPTIKNGQIDVVLVVKITDIDDSIKGTDVAFVSRQAQTQLLLDNRQTIILAGLIKHNDSNTVNKVAFLGDIPLLGALFRSRSTPVKDTELVIALTPSIMHTKKIEDTQVKLPSKELENFKTEVESKFDKEPLTDKPKEEVKAMVTSEKTEEKEEVKPTVLASSQVPSLVVLDYVRAIQVRISQAIAYPQEALDQNWEGTVKLRLRILRDGSLADCDLLESSGHDSFDLEAQKTTRGLAPFLAFPEEMQQEDIVITVPIVYNRHSNSKDTQSVMPSY